MHSQQNRFRYSERSIATFVTPSCGSQACDTRFVLEQSPDSVATQIPYERANPEESDIQQRGSFQTGTCQDVYKPRPCQTIAARRDRQDLEIHLWKPKKIDFPAVEITRKGSVREYAAP